jgi:Zn-finger nucleic acid-binding protein
MKCPNDGAVLTMSERSGVEIDYCPECRGVWLDRGELDKILDRAAAESPAAPAPSPSPPTALQRGYEERRGYQQGHPKPKRKEHWLAELFD